MSRKYNILSSVLVVVVAALCLQACNDDDLESVTPDKDSLVAQGRYLTARSEDASTFADDTERPKPFQAGTPYRLLAFTKPYVITSATEEENTVNHPRFNKVAWEGVTNYGLHYINIGDNPDKWFGFKALEGETGGGNDALVSLDFYGFTYGDPVVDAENKVTTPSNNYIELDGLSGETRPDETTPKKTLADLTRTESVANGELKDLMRGELLNQNILTAGVTVGPDGTQQSSLYSQSVMPFRHCFSKLRFQVSQQESETVGADGKPELSFKDLCIESIEVTGTYASGTVYLDDGRITLTGGTCDRQLTFKSSFDRRVGGNNADVGSMIIYPSDGAALRNEGLAAGYSVGLNITVKSTVQADIENMLINTGSVGVDGKPVITTEKVDGVEWYRGTISKANIIDYYDKNTNTPVYFKQNNSYMLAIAFQKDAVRIVTVVPQVEAWLPGEGTDADPWEDQAIGAPQMIDNTVWSDRNLGAVHYDPEGENFEKTIGYFYQSGRNIPYYPYDSKLYYDETAQKFTSYPDPAKKDLSILADVESYNYTRYRFYPIVDEAILNMKHQMSGWGTQQGDNNFAGGDRTWMIGSDDKPVMYIREDTPEGEYFDYMRSNNSGSSGLSYNSTAPKDDNTPYDMEWEMGQQRQPISGAWVIPSSRQFMSIFPTTPHAGNITFRAGGKNHTPMGWGDNHNDMDSKYEVIRVTVPYYYEGMAEPTSRPQKYQEAWRTLRDNNDIGTTCLEAYYNGGPGGDNTLYEPDGDPDDGYASVYLISREPGHEGGLPESCRDNNAYYIKSWGTIYAIKRAYTPYAYRLRIRVLCAGVFGTRNAPGLYVEVCRYRCDANQRLDEKTYKELDWRHPASTLNFPISGLGDWTGNYINFGTECQYATSDPIIDGKTTALQIKITGDNAYNAYIAIICKPEINRDFGKQIRPILRSVGGG